MLEREFAFLNRRAQREAESTVIKLQADLTVRESQSRNRKTISDAWILANELSFLDARESGIRAQQTKALEDELQLNRRSDSMGLKAQLEAEEHAVVMARTAATSATSSANVAIREEKHKLEVMHIKAEDESR
jgi:hypothetical protein